MRMLLDFDGVFTDPKPYAEAIKRELVRSLTELTGFEWETVYRDFEQGAADVLANPTTYGWKGDGILTCFGTEDPFIMNNASVEAMASRKPAYARKVADEYKTDIGWFCHKVHNEVTRDMQPHFRDGAKEVLDEFVSEAYHVAIVSNSETAKVERSLERLGVKVPVIGDARKFVVDTDFEEVEKGIHVGEYFVHLRRPYYFDVLNRYKGDDAIVVGDVFSLDLALPHHLGMEIALKNNDYTPEWSRKFVEEHGRVVDDLKELLDLIN